MKNLFFLLAITALGSTSAFARHNYLSVNCSNSKYEFIYLGNYPVGGYYSLSKKGESNSDKTVLMIPMDMSDAYSEEDIEKLGHIKSSILVNYSSKEELDPECDGFDTYTTKNFTRFKFTNLTKEDEANLGIKNGEAMYMKCTEVFSTPNRACAEE